MDSLPEEEHDYGEFPQAMLPQHMRRVTNRFGSGLDPNEQRDTINRLVMRVSELQEQLDTVNATAALPPSIPSDPSECVSSPVNSPVHPSSSPPDSPPVHLPSSPVNSPVHPIDSPFEDPANIQALRHLILLNYSKSEALAEVFSIDVKRDKSGNPNSKYQKAVKLFDRLKDECEQALTLEYRQQLEAKVNGN
jgi:hypothetical protein